MSTSLLKFVSNHFSFSIRSTAYACNAVLNGAQCLAKVSLVVNIIRFFDTLIFRRGPSYLNLNSDSILTNSSPYPFFGIASQVLAFQFPWYRFLLLITNCLLCFICTLKFLSSWLIVITSFTPCTVPSILPPFPGWSLSFLWAVTIAPGQSAAMPNTLCLSCDKCFFEKLCRGENARGGRMSSIPHVCNCLFNALLLLGCSVVITKLPGGITPKSASVPS